MKYKTFYFLHIPKTGGRFVKRLIIDPIKNILKENGIEILEKNPKLWHHGWHREIDDNTYIFSIIRDPVSWSVSYFTHLKYQENKAIDISLDNFHSQEIIKKVGLEKYQIFEWLEKESYRENYQSKNFLLNPALDYKIRMDQFFKNAQALGYEIDKEKLYNRIYRVNLLMRNEDFKVVDYNLLINKIFQDLGISSDYKIESELNRNHLSIETSPELYSTLDDFDKKAIRDIMSIDQEIYDNDNLFWKGH